MSALADNLATAAVQHGEVPYHFRRFAVNETTVISVLQNSEIAALLGLQAGFDAPGLGSRPRLMPTKLKDFPYIGDGGVPEAASQRADRQVGFECKEL